MRLEDDLKLDYADVLIRPKRSTLTSRRDVDLTRAFTFKHSKAAWRGVPIMAANMDGVGTFGMMNALANKSMFTCFVKNLQPQDFQDNLNALVKAKNFWAASTGSSQQDFERLMAISDCFKLSANHLNFVCIDIANGYSEHFGNFISKVRERLPNTTIIAGNVCTADMTQELVLRGADIVKIGIGPGAVCTTRIKTGVGYPQLSAVIECADAAHGLGAHIIADGGCTCPGDVAKAFAGGADFVMLGSMLAGHSEGGGDVISKLYHSSELDPNNDLKPVIVEKRFVKFYGMSSEAANKKHFGGLKDYRAAEGREVLVPYKGEVENTVQEILGGLRSTMTYVGASELKHLSKCATFVRTSRQYNNWFEGQTLAK